MFERGTAPLPYAGVSLESPASVLPARPVGVENARRWFVISFAGCWAIFLLLLNGYFVRSGDSEVYLSIARNLAAGKGYMFNGQPVATLPPLWPHLLAGAMKLSTQFWFLKLVPMACMAGFLGVSYWIMLRFTTPRRSAAVVLLCAVISHIHSLSFFFFSDGLFALLVCSALLFAMQINEGKPSGWRAAALVLCLIASIATRWNGVLWWPMIAAALLRGERRPRLSNASLCAAVSAVACAATFLILRSFLKVHPDQLDPRYDTFLAVPYNIVNHPTNFLECWARFKWIGIWIGGLLWDLINDVRAIRTIVLFAGWIATIGAAITAWRGFRAANLLGVGAALQLIVLAFDWPHPMPRYLLPMTPLVVLASWLGFEQMIAWWPKARPWGRGGIAIFLLSIALSNLTQYALEVWVQRAPDFYRHHEGGVNRSFVAAAQFLSAEADPAVEISVSQKLTRNGRSIDTSGPFRAFSFLSNRSIMIPPLDMCDEPDKELVKWATRHNVRYYLWQPSIEVTYHIRGTPWKPKGYDEGDYDWRLYRLEKGKFKQITIPPMEEGWARTVPGIP